ncbi:MAG TPA: amidohydrolase family protein [Acidimicrobiia bacterium]
MSYHDHHFHPFGYAATLTGLEVYDATSIDDLRRRLVEGSERTDGAVVAERLNDERLAERRLPTATELDEAVPNRPVLVYRYCGHIAVANTMALGLAGVAADTPDPVGGTFDRNPDGTPNGILRETAIDIVAAQVAHHLGPTLDSEIIEALRTLPAMGIDSVTAIASPDEPLWVGVDDEIGTLIRLAPDLPVSMDVLVATRDPQKLVDAAHRLSATDGPVRFHGWKGFADGSFGGHTAAMYEAYFDRPDTTGTVRLDHRHAVEMGMTSYKLGGVVAIHAIGDLANDIVLDVMDELISKGVHPESTRIEHASIMTPAAIERMARLGVTASVQPAFLASEADWLEKRLGPERMEMVYPFRSFLDAGIPVIGGSDAPVENPDPRPAIEAAVSRAGFNPEEALTREEAEALFAPPDR